MISKSPEEKHEEIEVDFDVPPSTPTQIAPNIFVGGRIELKYEDEQNFDLDSSEADTLSLLEPVAYLASTIKFDEKFEAYFNLRYSKEIEFEEEGRNDLSRPERLRVSQAHLYFRDIFRKTDLKIGRQRFDDDREWLYDESLDAVRVFHELGDIELELFDDKAPVTTSNFLKYIDGGLFDSTGFYRVVNDANQADSEIKIDVIQGGRYKFSNERGFPAIEHETTEQTGIKHTDGVISMARSRPGTATSEFFICIGNQPELDHNGGRNPDRAGFAAFGQVIDGMDIIKEIHEKNVPDQYLDTPVRIISINRK